MAEPVKTALISPVGGLIDVSQDESEDLLRQGYTLPTQQELAAHELQRTHGGVLGMAQAASSRALQGATLGYGAAALIQGVEAFSPERAALLRENYALSGEANPLLAGGAEIGGMVAGALLTRGGAAAGGEALAARAGLGRVGQFAAGGALEGGLYGGGEQYTQQVVRNTEFDGEALALGFGTGAAMGGVFSLGLSGAGKLASRGYGGAKGRMGRLFKKADAADLDAAVGKVGGGKAAPGVGAALKKEAAGGENSFLMKAATIVSGGDKVKARALYKAAATTKGREALLKSPEVMKKYGDDLFGLMERANANGQKAGQLFSRGGKAKQVGHSVKRGTDDEIVTAVKAHLDEQIGAIEHRLEDVINFGGDKSEGWLKAQRKAYQKAEQQVAYAIERGQDVPTTAFMAMDQAKREAQHFAFKKNTRNQMQDNVLDHFLDIERQDRKFLERTDIWGDISESQKRINHPWSQRIQSNTEDNFFKYFLEMDKRGAKRHWKPKVSRTKVDSYLRGLNDAGTSPAHKALVNERRLLQSHVDEVGARLVLTPADKAQLAETREIIKGMDGLIADAEQHVVGVNQLAQIHEYGSANSLTGLATGVGAGAVIGGPLGAAAGAAIGIAMNPQAAVLKLAAIEHYARKAGIAMDGKVGKLFSKTYERVKPAGAAVRRHAPLAAQAAAKTDGDSRQQFHARSDAIQAQVRAAGAARERLSNDLHDIRGGDPAVADAALATQQRQQDYLMAHMPTGLDLPTGPMGPRPEVSRTEAEEWLRRADAVENPMSVLDDLANGTLSHEAVDALQSVYPATYERLQSTVMDQMTDAAEKGQTLPYAERIQLGVLLDLPTDPTLDPALMMHVQGLIAGPAPEQAAVVPPTTGVEPHPKKAPDLASAYRTGPDKLAAEDEG